jgi:uncharacterized protein YkwD
MRKGLLYIAGFNLIILTVAVSSCSNSKPAAKRVTTPVTTRVAARIAPGIEEEILNLVNKYRRTKGLPALQNNFVIASVAREHTMNMATKRVAFGHAGFSARFKYITSKVSGTTTIAENVAYGSQTADEVVKEWLNSPGHKKNIEGHYRLTGIGVARDIKSRLYFTQIFAN